MRKEMTLGTPPEGGDIGTVEFHPIYGEQEKTMARDPYWPREFPIEIRDTHPEYPTAVARQYLCREIEDFQEFQGSPKQLVRCVEALIDCKIALALAPK